MPIVDNVDYSDRAGVGIRPAINLAETAGLKVEDGIVTDEQARTTDPHIWAAGDCATCLHNGESIHIESVGNAIDQAEVAACSMMGLDVVYKPMPWFWSDQYDCKLQIAGLNHGYNDVVIWDGKGFRSHWYYVGETLIAVDSINDVRGYMVGKRLIEAGKTAAKRLVSDPNADLKPLLLTSARFAFPACKPRNLQAPPSPLSDRQVLMFPGLVGVRSQAFRPPYHRLGEASQPTLGRLLYAGRTVTCTSLVRFNSGDVVITRALYNRLRLSASNQEHVLRYSNAATNATVFLVRSMMRKALMGLRGCIYLIKFGCGSRI